MPKSIKECISSDDPLSDEIINYLLAYQEETELLDFKVSIEDQEKQWLGLTKDVLAFANTHGGYLIFGVEDSTFQIIGLNTDSLALISDANKFMQKINRHIEPKINNIRSKVSENEGKNIIVTFIPESIGKTHLISKDASFTQPSGKEKGVLVKGTTYVRISAGNHLMDSRDIDDIVSRRLAQFKHSLLENITKVVEAPANTEIFVLSEDKSNTEHKRFVIQDGPDALPIKGLSFTVVPETIEQEVSGWIALISNESEISPPSAILWKWYRERETINLSDEQYIWVAKYSLLAMVPAFYWLKNCNADMIKEMLFEALKYEAKVENLGTIISTGAFLGKKTHQNLASKIGNFASKLSPFKKTIPHNGPKGFFRADNIQLSDDEAKAELNSILEKTKDKGSHIPKLQDKWRAQTLDCFLYAQDDHYISKAKS